jgi:hypothetical protein
MGSWSKSQSPGVLIRFLVESGVTTRLADEHEIGFSIWSNSYK